MGKDNLEEFGQRFDHQSFIIKFIFERFSEDTSMIVWRANIKHIPSGESKYFKTLDGILKFISPYLEQVGAKSKRQWWLTRWWRR
jgi:hypothetical protein